MTLRKFTLIVPGPFIATVSKLKSVCGRARVPAACGSVLNPAQSQASRRLHAPGEVLSHSVKARRCVRPGPILPAAGPAFRFWNPFLFEQARTWTEH